MGCKTRQDKTRQGIFSLNRTEAEVRKESKEVGGTGTYRHGDGDEVCTRHGSCIGDADCLFSRFRFRYIINWVVTLRDIK